MSLKIWLPLNKDLTNQGLSNVTVTNSGATLDNNGKLGKCYNLNGSSNKITISNLPNPANISVAFWMKRNATTNTRQFMFTAWGGVTCEMTTSNYIHCYTNGGGGACDSTTTVTADTGWVHVVYTFQDKVGGKLYLNGSLITSTASNASIDWTTTTGNIGNYSNLYYNGKMNDFRIYDHILSAKEVKEISKGLVAHYPLNGNGRNGNNILTNSTGYNGTTNWSGVISVGTEDGKPYLIAKRTDTTSTSRTFVQHAAITSLVSGWGAGTKFTISGYYKVPSTESYDVVANLFIRWTYTTSAATYADTGFNTPSTVTKDTWIRFEETYTVPSAYQDGNVAFTLSAFLKGLSTVYWKDVKLELGDHATPWMPNSADAEYTSMGYNSLAVYDTSGLKYDGALNTATSYNTNTPRYSVSTYFELYNSPSLNINNSAIFPALTNCSLAWWEYCTLPENTLMFNGQDTTRYIFAQSSSMYSGKVYDKNIGTGNVVLYKDGVQITTTKDGERFYHSTSHIQNEWHHFVLTGIDLSTWTEFHINRYNGSWAIRGYLSDFRIYATALSADDVKELYQTPVSISNNGTIFTQGEFIEN